MAINHEKMLDFIHKQTKLALTHMPVQHFDDGGTVLGGPTQQGPASGTGGNQGGLGNLLGVQNNFQATGAQVQAGTNNAQLNQAYNTAQSGITQQQNIANTLTPGVQTGANAQNQVLNQTLAESQGQGPNPAQAALNQSTGQNIQQTAALMASQRGAGANPGQLATQAAQTGAQTQQNAIGQSATLQAQQQLAAQAQAAGIAGTQINQGQNAVTGVNQVGQNEQNILQGANTSYNNANVAMQSNLNNTNAAISAGNQKAQADVISGLLGAPSAALSAFAKGGLVKMDKGGNVLDANARKHIAPHNFALPGGRYPIHDINHARNALARVSQNGTPKEKQIVSAAVHKKYPSIGKYADGGVVSDVPQQSTEDDSIQNTGSPAMPQKKQGSDGAMQVVKMIPAAIAMLSKGGQVQKPHVTQGYLKLAGGGFIAPGNLLPTSSQPQSAVVQFLNTPVNNQSGPNLASPVNLQQGDTTMGKSADKSISGISKMFKSNGSLSTSDLSDSTGHNLGATDLVPDASMDAAEDAGANVLADNAAEMVAYRGGLAATGGKVKAGKGQKAVVKGDSLKNDKVPAELSEGEIVIPRHITMAQNAPEKAAEFVRQTLARRKK